MASFFRVSTFVQQSKERHFFKHVGYESKRHFVQNFQSTSFLGCVSKESVQTFRMYIKALLNIVDSNQGIFPKHFGCESTHFVQKLWMKSNEFIQTSWIRIRSSWFNRYECTPRLCSNSLDAKEGLLKKKKAAARYLFKHAVANQHICSNMLVVKQSFCSNMLSARKGTCSNILDAKEVICSHLDANQGICSNTLVQKRNFFKILGYEAKGFVRTFWMHSRLCSNNLNVKEGICKASHWSHHLGYESTRLFKDFGCKTRLLFNFFPNILGFRLFCFEYFGCKAKHLLLHFGPVPKAYVCGCKASICKKSAKNL